MATLLLAEDEPILRMLVLDSLEDKGYTIDVACDGEEAMERILAFDYDLILLDYMMPKLDGIDIIRQMRAHPDRQHTKILMLSAKSQQSEREKVLAEGADGFMSKPFSPLQLIAKVEEMLNG